MQIMGNILGEELFHIEKNKHIKSEKYGINIFSLYNFRKDNVECEKSISCAR